MPLYIETDDGIRLRRAMKREAKQDTPKYDEMCSRYLAVCEYFSEEKLAQAGISRRYSNNRALDDCIQDVKKTILEAVSEG